VTWDPNLEEAQAEKARRHLAPFIRFMWDVLEPDTPLLWNWHIDAVCEALEAITDGSLRKLIINIPPGHMKSLIFSVFWPAWVWQRRPTWRSLFSAYAEDLAERDSVKCRDVLTSERYQRHFSGQTRIGEWGLSLDNNRKLFFENSEHGGRLALSVGGKGTGFRGDFVGVDDPINALDVYSKVKRERVTRWWSKTMSTRLNDKRVGARAVIMQRLHEEDLTGYLLEQGGWEHLCLPTEFEESRRCIVDLGRGKSFTDPRTEDGELLFFELFPPEVVEEAKVELGSDGFAGQHQQRPAPAAGLMLKKEWWRFWSRTPGPANMNRPKGCSELASVRLPTKFDVLLLSVDCAFKDAKANDSVSMGVWGKLGPDLWLLDRLNAKLDFVATVAAAKQIRAQWPPRPPFHHGVQVVLVEDKANGPAVMSTLRREIPGVVAFRPEDVGSKEARVSAISPYVEAGNVYLPEDASWLGDYIEQTAAFPRGKHDDDVDMTSQAVLRLFGLGGITEKDVIRVPRKPHVPKGSLYGGGM
jgi:predicted phage terminase large subunit-like protein